MEKSIVAGWLMAGLVREKNITGMVLI